MSGMSGKTIISMLFAIIVVSAGCARRLEVSADFSGFPEGEPVLCGVENICARGVDKNPRYKHSACFNDRGSCLQAAFEFKRIPEAAWLSVVHLSSASARARNGGWSPVTILINDRVVVKDHSPASHGYMTESWRVEPFLQKGRNTITFKTGELETHYWLQGFAITEGDKPYVPWKTKQAHRSAVIILLASVVILSGLMVYLVIWAGRRRKRVQGGMVESLATVNFDSEAHLPDCAPCREQIERASRAPHSRRSFGVTWCWQTFLRSLIVAFILGIAIVAVLPILFPCRTSPNYDDAISMIGNLRTKIELYRIEKESLPGLGMNADGTVGRTSKLSEGLAYVQTYDGTNTAAFSADFANVIVVTNRTHVFCALGVGSSELCPGYNWLRPEHFQYRIDVCEKSGRNLYALGVFGDGNGYKAGTGYAVLEFSDPTARLKGVMTWERYKPLRGAQKQVVMVNAEEARKFFKCGTPEQAREMNLCWVGDTEALMSGDIFRIDKAIEEQKRAGWQ